MKFILLLILPAILMASEFGNCINPGIKLGYELGTKKSLIIGFEVSYVRFNKHLFYYGPNVGVTKQLEAQRSLTPYFELETGWGPIGGAIGGEFGNRLLPRWRVFGGSYFYGSYKNTLIEKSPEFSVLFKYVGFVTLPDGFDLM